MGSLKDDVEVNHLIIPTNRMEEAKEHFRRRSINAFVFKTVMMEEAAKEKIQLSEADRQEGRRSLAVSLKSRNWTTNDFFLKGPMGEAMMRRVHAALRPLARGEDRTDGLSLDFGDWRLNLRASNTEPLLRLNVEAADVATMERVRDTALALIRA